MNADTLHFSTLAINPELREETKIMIEESLGYTYPNSFAIDFMPIFHLQKGEFNHLLLSDSNEVLGHIGISFRWLGNSSFQHPVALLGGIAIKKAFRGKGLFKKLMTHVLSIYQSQVSMFLLWSDLRELYEKYSFFQAGEQVDAGKQEGQTLILKHSFRLTSFDKLSQKQILEIENLHKHFVSTRYTTLLRTDSDWQTIRQMTSMNLFIKENSVGDILAYFFQNKGQDLPGIIHEYAWRDDLEDEVCQELDRGHLWLPKSDANRFTINHDVFLAFFRIGSIELFKKFVWDWSQQTIDIANPEKNLIHFKHKKRSKKLTVEKFFLFIFGPNNSTNKFGPPLFISGADSV